MLEKCGSFRRWPREPVSPNRYEWFVWKYGFPGPAMHFEIMTYLKGRAIRQYKKIHPGVALASGVRVGESRRRIFTAKPESQFEGITVYAPLLDWSTADVWKYVYARGYEKPCAYLTLGISGDCLCGAFARPEEREAITTFYPAMDARLQRLECILVQKWGARPIDKHQLNLYESLLCGDCGRGAQNDRASHGR